MLLVVCCTCVRRYCRHSRYVGHTNESRGYILDLRMYIHMAHKLKKINTKFQTANMNSNRITVPLL